VLKNKASRSEQSTRHVFVLHYASILFKQTTKKKWKREVALGWEKLANNKGDRRQGEFMQRIKWFEYYVSFQWQA
jgi:hypothetical protein